MKIKAVLFGATGMIGNGALLECLDHAEVESGFRDRHGFRPVYIGKQPYFTCHFLRGLQLFTLHCP